MTPRGLVRAWVGGWNREGKPRYLAYVGASVNQRSTHQPHGRCPSWGKREYENTLLFLIFL